MQAGWVHPFFLFHGVELRVDRVEPAKHQEYPAEALRVENDRGRSFGRLHGRHRIRSDEPVLLIELDKISTADFRFVL